MKEQLYEVGGHVFRLCAPQENTIWNYLMPYEPFLIHQALEVCFSITILPKVDTAGKRLLCSECDRRTTMPTIDIFKSGDSYLFELYSIGLYSPTSVMVCSADRRTMTLEQHGALDDVLTTFYSAMMLAYTMATIDQDTILTHSSCTLYDGKAYLFHARSGTGKSTHSSLWLKYMPGAELLNDDHPIIRLMPDGNFRVFGSPWSGKTNCFRNDSAQLGALVRLVQHPSNEIRRLSPVEAYASLSTSCNILSWERSLMDRIHGMLERIATTVPCYKLMCRPDEEAVRVCHAAVAGKEVADA